jgi:hypothetical protein
MSLKPRWTAFCAAALMLGFSHCVWASTIEAFIGTPTGTPTTDSDTQQGFSFYANPSGTAEVNELGFYVAGESVTASDHTVSIYDYNGANYTDLAQAVIPAGSVPDSSGYAWVSIPTITLTDTRQGADYYAVMVTTAGSDLFVNGSGATASSDSYFGTVFTLHGPESNSSPPGVGNTIGITTEQSASIGPNIGFSSVPEPASLGLFGISAAGLLVRRRRV